MEYTSVCMCPSMRLRAYEEEHFNVVPFLIVVLVSSSITDKIK